MAKDKTIASRTMRQRVKRKASGWHEVKVWVPRKEQADAIRNFASDCRTEQPNPKLELTEQHESAQHIGFRETLELSDRIFAKIKEQHQSLHRDACYRVVEETLDSLRIPPTRDEVTICLIRDGDEVHRSTEPRLIIDNKYVVYDGMVYSGPHHVIDNIWCYYQENHYFVEGKN